LTRAESTGELQPIGADVLSPSITAALGARPGASGTLMEDHQLAAAGHRLAGRVDHLAVMTGCKPLHRGHAQVRPDVPDRGALPLRTSESR
jgi:hypothetical protein